MASPASLVNPLPHLLHFNTDPPALICMDCRHAVNPRTLTNHFITFHRRIDINVRKVAVVWARTLSAPEKLSDMTSTSRITALPYVDITRNATRCHCGRCFTTQEAVDRHWRDHSNMTVEELRRLAEEGVTVQQIFAQPKTLTAVIAPPAEMMPPEEPLALFIRESLMNFQEHEEIGNHERAQLPSTLDQFESTPWLDETHWAEHLAGLNARQLTALTALPQADEIHLMQMCQIADKVLHHCLCSAKQCPPMVLRILACKKEYEYEHKPVGLNVQGKTFQQYREHWHHLLCYLLRAYGKPEASRLTLNTDQAEGLTQLDFKLHEGEIDEEEVQRLIFDLSVGLIEQPMYSWPFENPLLHFIAVYAIDAKNMTWQAPSTFTPALSGLIFISRILFLEKGLPQARRNGPFVQEWQAYHQQHIADHSLSSFTELIRLREFGMSIAQDHYSKPTCYWSPDQSRLFFQEHVIHLSSLRTMVSALLTEAQNTICKELVFQPISYLQTRDASHFSDSLTWASNDQCFINLSANNLEGGARRVLQFLQGSSRLQEFVRFSDSGPPQFISKAVNSYAGHVDDLLDMILILFHIVGGMPARGTELLCLKIRNSWSTQRNFYLVDGLVMFLTERDKGTSRRKAPRLIPRFLPPVVGQLYCAYVADIQPFLGYLRYMKDLPDGLSKRILWARQDKIQTTDRFSHLLGNATLTHLEVCLTVSTWRHVAIAVERDVVRGFVTEDFDPSESSASDLQAGHTENVARHHYGIRSDLLVGLTSDIINAMRAVSEGWHYFLNLTASAPRTGKVITPQQVQLDAGRGFDPFGVNLTSCLSEKRPLQPDTVTTNPPFFPQSSDHPGHEAALLREHRPPLSGYLSSHQEQAITAILKETRHLITILPTAGGKSLLLYMYARTFTQRMTIVVVPFTALLQETMAYCQNQGILCTEWKPGVQAQKTLVFVSANHAVHQDFLLYTRTATENGQLALVVFDEAHVVIKDAHWRREMEDVRKLCSMSPRCVLLSATLPIDIQHSLEKELNLVDPIVCRAPTSRLKISYGVNILDDGNFMDNAITMIDSLTSNLPPTSQAIIFAADLPQCDKLSTSLHSYQYHAKLDDKEEQLKRWQAGESSRIMVATSALGTGINVHRVDLIIHVDSLYTLTEFVQQSGRGGRSGQSSRSIVIIPNTRFKKHRCIVEEGGKEHDAEKLATASFVATTECRRTPIAAFMDGLETSCDSGRGDKCDNCAALTPSSPSSSSRVDIQSRRSSLGGGVTGASGDPFTPAVDPIPRARVAPVGSNLASTSSGRSAIVEAGNRSTGLPAPPINRLSNQDGQKLLLSTFNYLRTTCSVCFIISQPNDCLHSFSHCRRQSVDFNTFMDWRQGLDFKGSCHYKCGAPLFVCETFRRKSDCQYMDILLPLILIAFRTEPYTTIINDLARMSLNERTLLCWVGWDKDGNNNPLKLYSKVATNGILAFDAITSNSIHVSNLEIRMYSLMQMVLHLRQAGNLSDDHAGQSPTASDSLQRIYIQLAVLVHHDLTTLPDCFVEAVTGFKRNANLFSLQRNWIRLRHREYSDDILTRAERHVRDMIPAEGGMGDWSWMSVRDRRDIYLRRWALNPAVASVIFAGLDDAFDRLALLDGRCNCKNWLSLLCDNYLRACEAVWAGRIFSIDTMRLRSIWAQFDCQWFSLLQEQEEESEIEAVMQELIISDSM